MDVINRDPRLVRSGLLPSFELNNAVVMYQRHRLDNAGQCRYCENGQCRVCANAAKLIGTVGIDPTTLGESGTTNSHPTASGMCSSDGSHPTPTATHRGDDGTAATGVRAHAAWPTACHAAQPLTPAVAASPPSPWPVSTELGPVPVIVSARVGNTVGYAMVNSAPRNDPPPPAVDGNPR